MKARVRLEMVILLAIFLTLFYTCSKRSGDTGWSANIEIVDGIKVVTNPEEPKFGVFAFELEEDLAIGDVNDEAYFFPMPVSLDVDDEGTIYVLDRGNRRIQKYDNNGIYLRTIGRQGQGPGEYIHPSGLFLDDDGNPCVYDSRSVTSYDNEGVFQNKVLIKGFYSPLISGPHGTFLGRTQPFGDTEGGAKTSIIQVDKNGEPIQTIAEYPVSYSKSLKAVAFHWYLNRAAIAQRASDTFFYGFSGEYKVSVADRNGTTILIFVKIVKPQSISKEEKELTKKVGASAVVGTNDMENAIVFPDKRPFFTRFITDGTGRLYIIRFKSIVNRKDKISSVDVFSKNGIYLYQMSWPFIPAFIKNGFIYEVREDGDTGDIKVIRHKIINWDKFKEE